MWGGRSSALRCVFSSIIITKTCLKAEDRGLLYSSLLSCAELRTRVVFTGNGGGAQVGSGEGLQQAVMSSHTRAQTTTHRHLEGWKTHTNKDIPPQQPVKQGDGGTFRACVEGPHLYNNG